MTFLYKVLEKPGNIDEAVDLAKMKGIRTVPVSLIRNYDDISVSYSVHANIGKHSFAFCERAAFSGGAGDIDRFMDKCMKTYGAVMASINDFSQELSREGIETKLLEHAMPYPRLLYQIFHRPKNIDEFADIMLRRGVTSANFTFIPHGYDDNYRTYLYLNADHIRPLKVAEKWHKGERSYNARYDLSVSAFEIGRQLKEIGIDVTINGLRIELMNFWQREPEKGP